MEELSDRLRRLGWTEKGAEWITREVPWRIIYLESFRPHGDWMMMQWTGDYPRRWDILLSRGSLKEIVDYLEAEAVMEG